MFAAACEASRRVVRSPALVGWAVLATIGYAAVLGVTTVATDGLGDLLVPVVVFGAFIPFVVVRVLAAPIDVANVAGGERTGVAVAKWEHLSRRFAAVVAERAAIVAGGAVAFVALGALLLGAATAIGYGLEAAGEPVYQPTTGTLWAGVALLGVVGAVGGAPLRLAPGLAARGVSPRVAPAAGLRVGRDRPRSVALLGVLPLLPVAVVVGIPAGAEALLGVDRDRLTLVTFVVGLAVTAGVLAFGAAYRTVLCEQYGGSPGDVATPRLESPSRRATVAVVAVVLVVALVGGGAAAVRVADAGPTPERRAPVGATPDAAAVVEHAARAAGTVNHRTNATAWRYNNTAGEWGSGFATAVWLDYADHQQRTRANIGGTQRGHFRGGGTFAMDTGSPADGSRGLLAYPAGDWTVFAVPGWGLNRDPSALGRDIPGADARWRLLNRTQETVTVGITRPERLRAAYDEDEDIVVHPDSYVRMTVARETGYPERLEIHRNRTLSSGQRFRTRKVVRFHEWESYDLRRPAPLREPTPAEVVWDALEY